MLLSVIIPTCNRNEQLAKCLQCLSPGTQQFGENNFEVIVSDDGKNNEAKSLILEQFPWVQWVSGPKKGPAANRNCGAKIAKGKWLVFTDDDCLPDNNWLQAYAEAIIQHPECKAFEGAILPDDWKLLKKDMAECPVNTSGGCFWSANIMIKKVLFALLNGFDEQFKIAAQEDQEIFIRIKEKTKVVFCVGVVVIHPVRFGGLREKLKVLDASINSWLLYKSESSTRKIFKEGSLSQIRASFNNLKQGKFKSFYLNLATLFRFFIIICRKSINAKVTI